MLHLTIIVLYLTPFLLFLGYSLSRSERLRGCFLGGVLILIPSDLLMLLFNFTVISGTRHESIQPWAETLATGLSIFYSNGLLVAAYVLLLVATGVTVFVQNRKLFRTMK